MKKILNFDSQGFSEKLNDYISNNRSTNLDVSEKVKIIIESILSEGDKALSELTFKYDNYDIVKEGICVDKKDIDFAYRECEKELVDAIEKAADRISAFHERQLPNNISYKDDSNVQLASRWTPLDSVGLYVPGGKASYPSSVIMTAIPAKIAKVPEVSMCVPCPKGYLNPSILVAAKVCGIEKIYKI